MQIKKFSDLLEAAAKQPEKRLVAVNGVDENTLEALNESVEMGFVKPILTGNEEHIKDSLSDLHIDIGKYDIINAQNTKITSRLKWKNNCCLGISI